MHGFENKEIICTEEAHTVKELMDILDGFVKRVSRDADIVYVENGDVMHITARLIENTLTDGSKVYDVRLS